MSTLEIRPRFRFHHQKSPEEIIIDFRKVLKDNNPDNIKATLLDHHVHLKFPKEVTHTWSPQMDITLEEDLEDNHTLVRVLIAPAPNIWTMFMFFYAFLGFIGFVGLMIAFSQYSLGHHMWGLYIVPLSILGIILLWVLAKEGQHLAKEEMWKLKHFIDQVLECDCLQLGHDYREKNEIP